MPVFAGHNNTAVDLDVVAKEPGEGKMHYFMPANADFSFATSDEVYVAVKAQMDDLVSHGAQITYTMTEPAGGGTAELAVHAALATGVHGAGVSTLETVAGSAGKVSTHAGLSTGVHGVGVSTVESASGAQGKVDAHANAKVSAVHGGVFLSAEVTGNAAEQDTPHGYSATPTKVVAYITGLPNPPAQSDIVEGVHDGTNCKFTVTSGVKYRVMAWL